MEWDPIQLVLHGGQRLVVNGHSQSFQLIGLGKSFPLTSQQQSRLSDNSRVYSAQTTGSPQVPIPRLGKRRGCASCPEPYRIPTTLGHATKTGSHSSSTYYIETNTGRLKKQRNNTYERTDKNSRERTKQNGDKQSIRCKDQNNGYKNAQQTL